VRLPAKYQAYEISCIFGLAYGLIARAAFGGGSNSPFLEVMSLAFIFGVPIALGFITVWFGDPERRGLWLRCIFLPWVSGIMYLFSVLALYWEGLICIVLWSPVVLVLSSVGGLLAGLLNFLIKSTRNRNYCVAIVALLPFIAAPLEHLRQSSAEVRTVNTQIKIHANSRQVWNQIKSVPLIAESEQSFSFPHLLGFPRPLEAKLVGEGIGAVRYATFERDVLFVEKIDEWDEPRRLSFSIHADTGHISSKVFDEHVIVGGKYFDVLRGTYWIEPVGSGDVILHLSSNQRLSTRFNFYSHFWTEYLMADLQNYILHIIKRRCESPEAANQ
jgi:hypothetical protein